MFTRMAKVVLWIAGIAILITGLAVGSMADNFLATMSQILVIWAIGFVLLWVIGTYVEMINNIMDIKKLLSKSTLNNVQDGSYVNPTYQDGSYVNPTYQAPKGASNAGLNLSQPAQQKEIQKTSAWFCGVCGMKNSSHQQYCVNCGKNR